MQLEMFCWWPRQEEKRKMQETPHIKHVCSLHLFCKEVRANHPESVKRLPSICADPASLSTVLLM